MGCVSSNSKEDKQHNTHTPLGYPNRNPKNLIPYADKTGRNYEQ